MYSKIIVAVDIAEQDIAQPALAAALEMARLANSEIRLVHVRSPLPVTRMDFIPAEFLVEHERYSKELLQEMADKLVEVKGRVSTASRFGAVYSEVLEEAKEWGADIIVVSAHQPTMATYLLGSNAAKIVRHAHCSVLVVRGSKKHSLFE